MSTDKEVRPPEWHFEIIEQNAEKWIWVLYAPNRRPAAASPKPYRRRPDIIKACRLLIEKIPTASIRLAETAESKTQPDDDEPATPPAEGQEVVTADNEPSEDEDDRQSYAESSMQQHDEDDEIPA